ncbi:hypothetical protein DNTS_003514 [Danionella cerebrum]|uniref:THAP-type domain-containing protein n=1 Tax=Danionella cerebrum TaxID=2873325 RepID=A0A553MTS7_9TELE|nr:hypothetical protein DNTS_003514 [Danionella translucida]
MPKSCSAFNCKNRYSNKHPEITFHRFPFSKPSILNEWLKNIGRDDFQPRKHMVICSLHFTSDCFSGLGNRKNLLWNAVPTVFTALPQDLEKNISKKRVKRTSSVYKEDSTVGNAGIPVIADTALQSTKSQ